MHHKIILFSIPPTPNHLERNFFLSSEADRKKWVVGWICAPLLEALGGWIVVPCSHWVGGAGAAEGVYIDCTSAEPTLRWGPTCRARDGRRIHMPCGS